MLLARFQQYFEIQRSLIHTFTSFILLSYSRFILVSFLLLTTTPLFDRDGQVFGPRYGVVYYDGTIPFFSLSHAVVAAVSTFVLVVFAIIVPSLLVFPSLYRNLEIARKRWETFDLVIERFMTKRFPKVNICCEMNIINQFLKQYILSHSMDFTGMAQVQLMNLIIGGVVVSTLFFALRSLQFMPLLPIGLNSTLSFNFFALLHS